MMFITTIRVTHIYDRVKTLQDGPENAKEILWSEGPWLADSGRAGESMGKLP